MSEILVDKCPHCGGTSGVTRDEWILHVRFANWGSSESFGDQSDTNPKVGRWKCEDCGHRFNRLPFKAVPHESDGKGGVR